MNAPLGILGAGTMGLGLAQLACASGLEVRLHDRDPEALRAAPGRLRRGLRAARLNGWLRSDQDTRLLAARLHLAPTLEELAPCSALVECTREEQRAKQALLAQLEQSCPDAALVASNTSAIPVSALTLHLMNPRRVLALHLMNPVMARPAWELAASPQTAPEALAQARALAQHLGREIIQVEDGAGFVINRLLMLLVNEAISLLAQGRADAATVDRAMTRCLGHSTGPLATADMIGLDVVLDSLQVLCEHAGVRYQPHPVLVQMVQAGHLGQKSGRGFFLYR